ncbi:hypothetical protein M5689_003218 [Euphorbia peplus]|nr:hypothetical protein M5689_003218 [Euphorbia peplus]
MFLLGPTKRDCKIWKELIGKETGLGWDPQKKTIDASPEWWAEKIRVVPGASKFQKEDLDPDLVAWLDIMFGDTVASGEFAWAPSLVHIQTSEHIVHPLSDVDNLEQGSNGYSIEDFGDSLDVFTQSGNESLGDTSLEAEQSNKKQKGNDGCSSQSKVGITGRKFKNNLGGVAKLRGDISRLVDAVESRATKVKDLGTSLSEVMTDVESLLGVTTESELYYFAAYLFEQKARRDGYATMNVTSRISALHNIYTCILYMSLVRFIRNNFASYMSLNTW